MRNQEIVDVLEQAPIVPLYYHEDPATACSLMDACYLGGARALEFTNRGEHAMRVFTVTLCDRARNARLVDEERVRNSARDGD